VRRLSLECRIRLDDDRFWTVSAAIYGLRSKKDISIFILHPHKRISPIQEAQMTTVLDENVFNLSVDGTFDDCQVSLLHDLE
jgi:threonine synthase